jgi:hypothetical protein
VNKDMKSDTPAAPQLHGKNPVGLQWEIGD